MKPISWLLCAALLSSPALGADEWTSDGAGTGGTSGRYPVAEIDRPLALLPMVLEPEVKLLLDFLNYETRDQNWAALGTGVGFGILPNLEAGLGFPLRFAPEAAFVDLDFYGLYDLTSMLGGAVNLAGRLDMVIPTANIYSSWGQDADFILFASGLLKYKIISKLAALASLSLGAGFYEGENAFLFFFDYGVLFQAKEPLAFTLTSGFYVFAGRGDTNVPLRLRGQYTINRNIDIFLEMAFPDLNVAKAEHFQFLSGAAFRIGL